MLAGYSHNAVVNVIGAVVTAALHHRSQGPSSDPGGTGAGAEALGTSLRAAFAHWEKEVLVSANPTFRLEFRTLATATLEVVRHQEQFGPTLDRAN